MPHDPAGRLRLFMQYFASRGVDAAGQAMWHCDATMHVSFNAAIYLLCGGCVCAAQQAGLTAIIYVQLGIALQVQQLQRREACDVVRQRRHMAPDLHVYTDANLQGSRSWFCLACVRRMHAHHEHGRRSGVRSPLLPCCPNMQTRHQCCRRHQAHCTCAPGASFSCAVGHWPQQRGPPTASASPRCRLPDAADWSAAARKRSCLQAANLQPAGDLTSPLAARPAS